MQKLDFGLWNEENFVKVWILGRSIEKFHYLDYLYISDLIRTS